MLFSTSFALKDQGLFAFRELALCNEGEMPESVQPVFLSAYVGFHLRFSCSRGLGS